MKSARVEQLRDRLLQRGAPTIFPRPAEAARTPETQALYTRVRPFAEAMFLVMSADETRVARECDALRGALRTLTSGALSSNALNAMVAEFETALAAQGAESRLDDIAARLYGEPEDGELAVALAAAVGVADDALDPAERAIIEGLAERLSVPEHRLRALLP